MPALTRQHTQRYRLNSKTRYYLRHAVLFIA